MGSENRQPLLEKETQEGKTGGGNGGGTGIFFSDDEGEVFFAPPPATEATTPVTEEVFTDAEAEVFLSPQPIIPPIYPDPDPGATVGQSTPEAVEQSTQEAVQRAEDARFYEPPEQSDGVESEYETSGAFHGSRDILEPALPY